MLAFIVLVYETLGGMRAVAWTDCVQGMLLIGLLGLLLIVIPDLETLGSITQWIARNQPEKSAPPSGGLLRTWISTLLLVAFGGAVYPQAIQRIYMRQRVKERLKPHSV